LSDEKWRALSKETQDWVTAGIKAMNGKEKIKTFPDAEPEKPRTTEEKKEAAPKRGRGTQDAFQEIFFKNPTWSMKQVTEEFAKTGKQLSESGISATYYNAKRVYKLLKRLNLLREQS